MIMTLLLATLIAADPSAPPDPIAEYSTYCARGTALWGKSLCGPILLVDPASRAAIASQQPGIAGFKRDGKYWVGQLPAGTPVANTSVMLSTTRWAEMLMPLPDDATERRVLMAHENFHRIQPDLGFVGKEADNAHLDDTSARILARLEFEALKAALGAKDWRRPAAAALGFRARRLALFPMAAAGETSLIANEGLAEYTGIRVGAGSAARTVALDRLAGAASRPSLLRSLGYIVGPAYGLLLDRVGAPWRAAALRGTALPDLLGRNARLAAARAPSEAAYGGAAIRTKEAAREAALAARKSALETALVTGPTVTFPFVEMGIDFNPNTLVAMGAAGTAYQKATIRDSWGELKVDGDVLIAPDWSFARVGGPMRADGRNLVGSDWSIALAPGYRAIAGKRQGDFVISKE